ncbi:MAG TPA: hypothetical protein EYQ54_10280 [Myxococcales bacterium]|nr:hypothetical protein [Myxococcales bacterium]
MDYLIDCRKNWRLAKDLWAEEKDPRRRRILETLIAHAEAAADFPALMETVSPQAHYRSYATPDPATNEAQSPRGKEAVAAYYSAIAGFALLRARPRRSKGALGDSNQPGPRSKVGTPSGTW